MIQNAISKAEFVLHEISEILIQKSPPSKNSFYTLVVELRNILEEEFTNRPLDRDGHPGGIVCLNENIATIIVPDVHGRREFIHRLCVYKPDGNRTTLQMLESHSLQIVFVGDGMHCESREAARWKRAKSEYMHSYKKHSAMDEEMCESFGAMRMIMLLKKAFPDLVHYLKGNHDNILNEKGNGNYPFMKFAFEGPMVLEYVRKFYGKNFLQAYALFEKSLPLLAVGTNFLISHSEPADYYSAYEIINYRTNPHAVEGLTWTDNGSSVEGSVELMLARFIDQGYVASACYFGGHRPVAGLYGLRAFGRYVQIHNPAKYVIVTIQPHTEIILSDVLSEI